MDKKTGYLLLLPGTALILGVRLLKAPEALKK